MLDSPTQVSTRKAALAVLVAALVAQTLPCRDTVLLLLLGNVLLIGDMLPANCSVGHPSFAALQVPCSFHRQASPLGCCPTGMRDTVALYWLVK